MSNDFIFQAIKEFKNAHCNDENGKYLNRTFSNCEEKTPKKRSNLEEGLEPNPNRGNESLDQDAFEDEEPLVRMNVNGDIFDDLNQV